MFSQKRNPSRYPLIFVQKKEADTHTHTGQGNLSLVYFYFSKFGKQAKKGIGGKL
jgi:hypothetical protein